MMFPGGGGAELAQAASSKVKNDVGTFVIFGLLVEAVAIGSSYFGIDWMLMNNSDPQMARFLQQLQAETQRQKFTEQVHTLASRCWDLCLGDSRPPSKLDGKTQTCIQNCVNRMIDASSFMVEHLQKMETGRGGI